MRKNFGRNKGICSLAFALGLILSCVCPPKFLVAILALWVIILGISSCR